MSDDWFEQCLAGPPLRCFEGSEMVAAMLRFEGALCRAQASAGVLPRHAPARLEAAMASFCPDASQLAVDGAHAGSVAIPLVAALRRHVAEVDPEAATWLHVGATSQDVIDTALVLCATEAWRAVDAECRRAIEAACDLGRRFGSTPALARTLLQPAGVTTVGFRAAQWAQALSRCRARVRQAAESAAAVSLGGAAGDLAALGDKGPATRAALAAELGLRDPGGCWHALRDDWVALHAALGTLAGIARKIAADIARLAQPEIAELREPAAAGRGGSTAMPHKRNPVLCMRILALTHGVPELVASLMSGLAQEHERSLGAWQAELLAVPVLWSRVHAAVACLAELLAGLEVDMAHCRANIDALGGLIFADKLVALWAPMLGTAAAKDAVEALCRRATGEGGSLEAAAAAFAGSDSRLRDTDITGCFDVAGAAMPAARQASELLGAKRVPPR